MLHPPEKFHQLLLDIGYNIPILFLESILPHGGMGILTKRDIFEKVGGFDSTIWLAEDMHFMRQARKFGKFGIFRSIKLLISPRRFQRDGWIRTYLKFIFCELHMIFLGPVRSHLFGYQFNHYEKDLP